MIAIVILVHSSSLVCFHLFSIGSPFPPQISKPRALRFPSLFCSFFEEDLDITEQQEGGKVLDRTSQVRQGPRAHTSTPGRQGGWRDCVKMLEEDFEKTIKVLIVGNGRVGKSSMIRRFCTGTFTNTYKRTIGVDFLEKVQYCSELGEDVRMMLWDTAGQVSFGTHFDRATERPKIPPFRVPDLRHIL